MYIGAHNEKTINYRGCSALPFSAQSNILHGETMLHARWCGAASLRMQIQIGQKKEALL